MNPDRPTNEPIAVAARDREYGTIPLDAPTNSGVIPAVPLNTTGVYAPKPPRTLLKFNKVALFVTGGVIALVLIAGLVAFGMLGFKSNDEEQAASKQPVTNYGVKSLDTSNLNQDQLLTVSQATKLTINGELQVGSTFVLTPTATPSLPRVGQIYYDKATNTPYVYNGSTFISMVAAPGIESLGGATGVIGIGNGLQLTGGQLAISNALQQGSGSRVSSLQGQTGDVVLRSGNGIVVSGTTISNAGIINVVGTSGINVLQSNGTATVSISGLPIGNGGTNTDGSAYSNRGVFYFDGTKFATTPTAATNKLCLLSGPTGPYFDSCSSATPGVTLLNGAGGSLAIADSTVNSGTGVITLNDASTTQKGIARFNTSDFSVSSGVVSLHTNVTKAGNSFNGNGQLIKLDASNGASTAINQCLMSTATGAAFKTCAGGGNISSGTSQTVGALTKFDTTSNSITNSIASEAGSVLTIAGTVSANFFQGSGASLTSLNANNIASGTLSVARGGTGQASFTANGVLIGNGASGLATLAAGSNGQCLMIVSGAPAYSTCTGAGGVASLNGLVGVLTLANATPTGGTITINDASTSQKGIASYNNSNFSVSAGVVNTIQGIGVSATPTFGSLILQSASASMSGVGAGGTTNLVFATQSGGTTKTISIPNTTGTIAVAATGPLSIDSNGVLSCANCLTSGGGGGTAGVSSLNTLTGGLTLAGANGITINQAGSTITITAPTSSAAVSSVNGLTGSLTVANASNAGSTITINDATSSQKGIASFGSSDFTVTGGAVALHSVVTKAGNTFNGIGQLLQLDGTTGYLPSLNGSLLTGLNANNIASGTLSVSRGGTGANNFTANGLLYGNGTGAVGVTSAGTTGQCLVSNGASTAPSFQTCTGAGGVMALTNGAGISTSNSGGNYTITNTGVTQLQGTTNQVTVSGATGNITLSLAQSINTTADVQFGTAVLTGANGLSVGVGSATSGVINFKNASNNYTTSLRAGAPASGDVVFTLPATTGTLGQCLTTNGSGSLSFSSCLTGAGGGAGGVLSVQGTTSGTAISGAINVANASTSGNTVTIDTATTTAKGIASFDTNGFNVSAGAVSIKMVGISQGGTGITTTPTAGQLLLGNTAGTGYTLGSLYSGDGTLTVAQTGTGLDLSVQNASNIGTCTSCANNTLSNLGTTAVNANIIPATNNSVNIGSASKVFANGYFNGLQITGLNTAGVVHTNASGVLSTSLIANADLNSAASYTNITRVGTLTQLDVSGATTLSGQTLVKNTTNSTTAFQIQSSGSATLLNADTTNMTVNVGTTSGTARLNVVAQSSGYTWTNRGGLAGNWRNIAYGNGVYVAIGDSGTNSVMTSTDGTTWTARTPAEANNWSGITYGNGVFVAVASNGTNRVMTSTDGITWTARSASTVATWYGVTYGNNLFVAVGGNGVSAIMTSTDGITWTTRSLSGPSDSWKSVTYGNGVYVAVGGSGTYYTSTSPDGITWTTGTVAAPSTPNSVTYGAGTFVMVGYNYVMTSTNGSTWTSRTVPGSGNNWNSVTYGNGTFMAISSSSYSNMTMTSPDGITWASLTGAYADAWQAVGYGGGRFVAIAGSAIVYTTTFVMTTTSVYGTPAISATGGVSTDTLTVAAGGSINGAGALTVSAGGTNQTLTLQGSGTGGILLSGAATVSGNLIAQAGLYTGIGVGTIRIDGNGTLQNVKFGSSRGIMITDGSGNISTLSTSGAANNCLSYDGSSSSFIWSTCSGSGGASGYANGGSNITSNATSACGSTATTQIATSFATAITNPTIGLCTNSDLDILTNNISRVNISAGGDMKILSNSGGSSEKLAVRTLNDGNSSHYFNTLSVDTSTRTGEYNGRVGIGLLVGTAPEVRLDIGGNATSTGSTSNGGLQMWASGTPGLSHGASNGGGALSSGRIFFDEASGKFKVSENGGAYVNLIQSASSPFSNGGNAFGSQATLGTTDSNGLRVITNNAERMTIDSSGNMAFKSDGNIDFTAANGTVLGRWDHNNTALLIGTTSGMGGVQLNVQSKINSNTGFSVGGTDGVTNTCTGTYNGLNIKGGLITGGYCAANNSDLAEAYNSTDSLVPGELVMAAGTAVTSVGRANAGSANGGLMGIVSTAPSQTIGTAQVPNGYPIALSGRVPTKVNTEGGAIQVGDKITISSAAGVGKKATSAGMIVGTAMEAFNGAGVGSIEVFVNLTYYQPTDLDSLQAQTAMLGDLNVSGMATINNLTVTGLASVHDLAIGGHIITTGGQPTNEVQAAAGAGAVITVSGTDTTGTITITTGTTPTSGGMAKLVFSELYAQAPRVVLSPSNDNAASVEYYKGLTTADGFVLNFKSMPQAGTTYIFDYFIAQ